MEYGTSTLDTAGHDAPVAGVEQRTDAVLVRLANELDLYTAHLVRDTLLEAIGRSPERLIVDLSEVTFVDSTALGVLIEARGRLANGRAFLLVAPGVETRRALAISGLDRHFAVHESIDAALAASV